FRQVAADVPGGCKSIERPKMDLAFAGTSNATFAPYLNRLSPTPVAPVLETPILPSETFQIDETAPVERGRRSFKTHAHVPTGLFHAVLQPARLRHHVKPEDPHAPIRGLFRRLPNCLSGLCPGGHHAHYRPRRPAPKHPKIELEPAVSAGSDGAIGDGEKADREECS
ncbi:MAG: hypothetical protein WCI95_11800, partial [bacterium]